MFCRECEQAEEEGYAYWCSICSSFIPSKSFPKIYEEAKEESLLDPEINRENSSELESPDADTKDRAGIILLNQKNEILLVRGPTGKLSMPKGKRKVKENNYEAACRECLEESGVDVKGMPVYYSVTLANVVYFIVSYTGLPDIALSCVNGSEIHEIKWFSLENGGELMKERQRKKCNHSLDIFLGSKHVKKALKWNLSLNAGNVA